MGRTAGLSRRLQIGAALCLLIAAGGAAGKPKTPYSAIYCQFERHDEFSMFLAKELPDGRLNFYVDRWLTSGALTGDQGVAEREGDHWVFDSPRSEDTGRCRLRIWLRKGGAPDIVPDKATPCIGGYNSPMPRVTFSRRSYYKPVTNQLDADQSPMEDDACRGSPAEAAQARQRARTGADR